MLVISCVYIHTYKILCTCIHTVHTYIHIHIHIRTSFIYTAVTLVVHVYAGPCTEWPEAASGETYWKHPVPQRHQLSKTGSSNQTYIACM